MEEKISLTILLFYSEEEKEKFKDYVISKWGSRDKYLKDIHIPIWNFQIHIVQKLLKKIMKMP